MNQIWIVLIIIAVLVTAGFLVALLIKLIKLTHSLTAFLKTTGESTKIALDELHEALKSIKSVSDNIHDVTGDVKTFSGAIRDVGENVHRINSMVEKIRSSALVEVSSLKVGFKTAFAVLLSNLLNNLLKKGGKQ
ncbi:MAG: DUF948 domain-containing protein [Nitrospirae bacterium]|nr:DUF948 domain-containing protein [Nitrospirota bacterium]